LISIRVSDDAGEADSFALAAGILAAVDEKVDLINISMGSEEDNSLIREAITHAQGQGMVIIASSGNSESGQSNYPAAYPGVISVGAVDANRKHLDFSNFGDALSLTAPGWALNAAWSGNRYACISGTSASAPIVTGAIAATMSDGKGRRMSAVEASEIVMRYTDEAGIPGPDSQYGIGILNMGRVLSRNAKGIFDVAITDQRLIRNRVGDGVQVTIQNRGNEVLINVMLTVQTPDGTRDFNTTTLPPGGLKSFTLPLRIRGDRLEVRSSVIAHPGGRDITPEDNVRTDRFVK
jgi:subtilisin family serine protease